jgi:two-component system nitrate/nitrite response regulator NarL
MLRTGGLSLFNPIRVFLVDGPTLNRRCLALALSRKRRLQVVGEAADGSHALAEAPATTPDVIVVDPSVPEGGPTLVADLSQQSPQSAVVVLTQGGDESAASRALQAGARGYLQRDCEPEALFQAIDRVYHGELVVAPAFAETALTSLGGKPARASGSLDLTGREMEVLHFVALGQTNQEVARELFITEHTVKSHLAKIQGKLGLTNRVQLAAYATERGMRPLAHAVGL